MFSTAHSISLFNFDKPYTPKSMKRSPPQFQIILTGYQQQSKLLNNP
jgi:hypothetical protein